MAVWAIKIMKKIIIMLMMLSMLPMMMGQTTKIYPSDDAFVRNNYPSTNFGSENWANNLRAGYEQSFGIDRSYLKFDLSSLQGETITSASFSIFSLSTHDDPSVNLYYVSNDAWSETSITWSNKPSYSTLIGSVLSIDSPERIEFDVSSYLSESELSFALIENGENGFANFYSKDLDTGVTGDETFWPYIEVTYEGDCETGADTNGNGVIEMMELLDYISEWKAGSVGMMDLLNAISYWKAGAGC